jgi:hypothetical protein
MANQNNIRSDIRAFLPSAEESLVKGLAEKVEAELDKVFQSRRVGRRKQKATVERVISQEELAALGLRRAGS